MTYAIKCADDSIRGLLSEALKAEKAPEARRVQLIQEAWTWNWFVRTPWPEKDEMLGGPFASFDEVKRFVESNEGWYIDWEVSSRPVD